MRRVIITSGGTREKIDDFRLITNISSGALGARIVNEFINYDYDIDFVCTRYSEQPFLPSFLPPPSRPGQDSIALIRGKTFRRYVVESASDAFDTLKEIVPHADAIVHAMAVADFGFKKDANIKLKSTDLEGFLAYLREKAVVNPKIISHFREWNPDPNFYIVQFKFEINTTEEELVEIAKTSLARNKANLCVANDKLVMQNEQRHNALFVYPNGTFNKVNGKTYIAEHIRKHVGLAPYL